MSTTEINKAIVRRLLEALDRHEFDVLDEHPGLFQVAVRQPLLRKAFPDLRTTIEHQMTEGDYVATRFTLRGTHRETFLGIRPERQEVTVGVLMMDEIVDGKIVSHYAHADWIGLLISLGAVPLTGERLLFQDLF